MRKYNVRDVIIMSQLSSKVSILHQMIVGFKKKFMRHLWVIYITHATSSILGWPKNIFAQNS